MLTAFDYTVIMVIGLSMLRGIWRGLLAELFSLIGWILALIAATIYVPELVRYIPVKWPGGALMRYLVAFCGLVLAILLISRIIRPLIIRIADIGGLRVVDRILGMLLGLIRGLLLVLILVVLAGLTNLPRQNFWRHAISRPYTEHCLRKLKPFLPAVIEAYMPF
ncbi:CvpA family protein [Candidatus Vallotia tarda]|uniref:Colicin V production protein n=1 Tax=Candidatus Vallotiella hemipterorum TaxID=1177213 RepID=A0A916NLF7_9BURK|nr:CvpA family protein [Candidatus Vallotia tarda]CAG7601420.1 Colicin V production protein [Candidatus Vallotia tarda]